MYLLERKNHPNKKIIIEKNNELIRIVELLEVKTLLKPGGLFDFIEDRLIAIYKFDEKTLHFVYDDNDLIVDYDFEINYNENGNGFATLEILCKDKQYTLVYDTSKLSVATTGYYSESDEDVNFGLWCRNVLNNPERKKIVLDNWAFPAILSIPNK